MRCADFNAVTSPAISNASGWTEISKGLEHARLADALLRLRPFGAPPKNSVFTDALGVPGPCFAARETSENFTDDILAEETLGLRARRLGCTFQRLCQAPFRSAIGSGDCAATPVTLGSCLMVRRSHGYPDFLPRLTHRRDVCVAWIRLPSVVATKKTFSPEHGVCQIKFFRWSQRRARYGKTKPDRLGVVLGFDLKPLRRPLAGLRLSGLRRATGRWISWASKAAYGTFLPGM